MWVLLQRFSHISNDNGRSWNQIASEPEIPVVGISGRTFDVIKIGTRLVAASNLNGYNPYYSNDSGKTWKEASGAKLFALKAYGRKFVKMPNGDLYLNNSSLFVSKDSGLTWSGTSLIAGLDFTLWKTDQILASNARISLDGSVSYEPFEFAGTTAGLVVHNNQLHTFSIGQLTSNSNWHRYDGKVWSKDSLKNSSTAFAIGKVHSTAVVADSLFLCTSFWSAVLCCR